MSVDRVRVGDVLKLDRDAISPRPDEEYTSIGVRSFGKGIFHYDPKRGAELGKLRFFELKPRRLVVSNIKAWEGAVAVSTDVDRGRIASNRFLQYVPTDDRINVEWARWYFLSDAGLAQLQAASPGSADRNRTLAIDRFESLEVPLPSVDEQGKIAERLDEVSRLAGRVSEQYDHARDLTTALAISGCCLPHWDESIKSRNGWQWARLSDLMSLSSERVPVEPSANYPNVGIYSFGRGLFAKPHIEGASTSAKTLNRIHAGQFIYSRLFAFEGAYAYVSPKFDGHFVSNEFPTFDTDSSRLNAEWLATALRSPDRWAELAGSSKGLGMRRQRIPVEAVLAYEMWIPPIEEQQQMVQTVSQLNRAAAYETSQRERLDALVPAALNEAFSGLS